jgi:hypothetical protein
MHARDRLRHTALVTCQYRCRTDSDQEREREKESPDCGVWHKIIR